LEPVDEFNIEIVASDIDTEVLRKKKFGIYNERSLQHVSPQTIAKYMKRVADGNHRLMEELRNSVKFTQANLMEAMDNKFYRGFSVVFCRNLLIYFDDLSRRESGELVPTQLTHLAHDGLIQFSRLFFKVATTLKPDLSAFAIVPVQIDMRTHIQQLILAKLLIDFGTQRIFRGIRPDVALAEAFGSGRRVRGYRPGSRGAADYGFLAQDVVRTWAG